MIARIIFLCTGYIKVIQNPCSHLFHHFLKLYPYIYNLSRAGPGDDSTIPQCPPHDFLQCCHTEIRKGSGMFIQVFGHFCFCKVLKIIVMLKVVNKNISFEIKKHVIESDL